LLTERQALQSLCDEHEKMTNFIQQRYEILMQERKEIQQNCQDNKQAAIEAETLLENETNLLKRENLNLQKTVNRVTSEKDELEQKNASLQNETELLDMKIEKLNLDIVELNNQLEEVIEQLEKVTNEFNAEKSVAISKSAANAEMNKENTRLEKELADLNEKTKKFKEANRELALELARVKGENFEMENKVNLTNVDMTTLKLTFDGILKKRVMEAESLKDQLVKVEREGCAARKQLEELHTHVKALANMCKLGSEEKSLQDSGGNSRGLDKKLFFGLREHITQTVNDLRTLKEESQRSLVEKNALCGMLDELKNKYNVLCVRHLESLKEWSLINRNRSFANLCLTVEG